MSGWDALLKESVGREVMWYALSRPRSSSWIKKKIEAFSCVGM